MGHRLMVMGGQRFELFTHLPIASHKLPFTRQRLELFSLIFSHSGPGATGLDALQPCLHVQFFRGRSLTASQAICCAHVGGADFARLTARASQ